MEKLKVNDEKLRKAAEAYQANIVKNNPDADAYDFFNAFIAGANWVCENPTGGALLYAVNKSYNNGYKDAKFEIEMGLRKK